MASKDTIPLGVSYDDMACPGCTGPSDEKHYPEVNLTFPEGKAPSLPENGKLTFLVERTRYSEDDRDETCSYTFKLLEIVDIKSVEDTAVQKAKEPRAEDVLDKLMHEAMRTIALKDGPDSELAEGPTYGSKSENGSE